ncbi:hypothetical protein D3260_10455 [Salinisphaera sp. Q1T1-3]|nr:hypothetical protein D3260_10455 [Salinisphaera sp. Q1T1-3]
MQMSIRIHQTFPDLTNTFALGRLIAIQVETVKAPHIQRRVITPDYVRCRISEQTKIFTIYSAGQANPLAVVP